MRNSVHSSIGAGGSGGRLITLIELKIEILIKISMD